MHRSFKVGFSVCSASMVAFLVIACGGSSTKKAASSDTDGGDGSDADGAGLCSPGTSLTALSGDSAEVLYTNDFEHPNMPLSVTCGNSLDPAGINILYGTPSFQFAQTNTVEGVVIHDPSALYSDPSGTGGNYALGMLASYQDDLLALTFQATDKPFLNVGLDLAGVDVQGCGGPFGVDVPIMQVSLYDTSSAVFDFGASGTLLDQGQITGVAPPDQWTFNWHYGVVSLDASGATGDYITVLFDLKQSGYAAFDNLSIVSATAQNVVDRNNDGVIDSSDCK